MYPLILATKLRQQKKIRKIIRYYENYNYYEDSFDH